MPKASYTPPSCPRYAEFVGASHVTDGGKQRVLHERPQQHARTECLRCLLHQRQHIRLRCALLAPLEAAVLLANRLAAPIEVEQRHAAFVRRHLRVVAAGLQRRARFRRQAGGFTRVLHFTSEHSGHDRLGGRVRGVVDNQSLLAEDRFEELAERVGHSHSRPVDLPAASRARPG